MPVSAQEAPSPPDPTVVALEREKLAQEVAKLQEETARLRSQNDQPLLDWLRNNAVVVSGAVVALIGVFRWFAERRQDRERRDEDRLSAVFDGLGSPDELARINAAHNLYTFLEPGYERFHTRILHLVVAHLRHQSQRKDDRLPPKPKDDQLRPAMQGLTPEPKRVELPLFTQALVAVFKDVYPRGRSKRSIGRWVAGMVKREADRPGARAGSPLDMSGVQLPGAYLVNTDLSDVFMPYADLTGAYLSGATLTGATLIQADLTGANPMRVKGLTPEQHQMAAEQGAVLDEPDPPL
jgi:hypothetical protein